MNNRKYNNDPDELLNQGKEIMSSSDDSKYYFRVFAVNMVLAGTPASAVGKSGGVSKAAVTGWVKTADEIGFEALHTKSRPGRPRKLSESQYDEIDKALQNDPKEHGINVWDGPSLASYIKDTFDVSLSVRQCQRLLHSLGYSKIRPQTYPSKGYEDTEERENFKKNAKK